MWHQVVAIDSWTPYWFANVGFAHLLTGDAETAVGYFDRALAIAATTGAASTPPRRCAAGRGPPGAGRRRRPPRPTWPRRLRSPNARVPRCSPRGPGRPWTHRHDGGPDDRPGPRRIAIIGGGMAGLAAAWRLSGELGAEAEITVYEQGWQLGGKGASGRGVHGRIEEHGLHVWLGYYDNAFRLIRQVYDDLDRDRDRSGLPDPQLAGRLRPRRSGRRGGAHRSGLAALGGDLQPDRRRARRRRHPRRDGVGGRVPPAWRAAAGRLLHVAAGDAGDATEAPVGSVPVEPTVVLSGSPRPPTAARAGAGRSAPGRLISAGCCSRPSSPS